MSHQIQHQDQEEVVPLNPPTPLKTTRSISFREFGGMATHLPKGGRLPSRLIPKRNKKQLQPISTSSVRNETYLDAIRRPGQPSIIQRF